jgi:ankyrin repeat protein
MYFFKKKGYAEIVRLLLEHGAKVEETNENGHTPLVIRQKETSFFLKNNFFL